MWLSGRNVFQAEATACAKALRQECAHGQRGCNWVRGGECCRRRGYRHSGLITDKSKLGVMVFSQPRVT